MFQFIAFPSICYFTYILINQLLPDLSSLIRTSTDIMDICSSPWLFAACHVLLRLLVPRHSPYALCSLTFFVIIYFVLLCQTSYRSAVMYQRTLLSHSLVFLVLLVSNPKYNIVDYLYCAIYFSLLIIYSMFNIVSIIFVFNCILLNTLVYLDIFTFFYIFFNVLRHLI